MDFSETTSINKGEDMTKTVFSGLDIAYQMEESNNVIMYNSIKFLANGKEVLPQDLKLVFCSDEEQDNERDINDEVTTHLLIMFTKLGIDRPTTFDDMVDFIVDDVEAAADPVNWHSGDIEIGFRRYLERGYEG